MYIIYKPSININKLVFLSASLVNVLVFPLKFFAWLWLFCKEVKSSCVSHTVGTGVVHVGHLYVEQQGDPRLALGIVMYSYITYPNLWRAPTPSTRPAFW